MILGASAQVSISGAPAFIVFGVIGLLELIGIWKVFTKAGHPGWACIIPIYNYYTFCKVAGRPGWWVILAFIPLVNIIVGIIVLIDVAKAFGKGTGFGLGLIILGFLFFPILGFGSSRYQGAITR